MLTYEEICNYCKNYKMVDGVIYENQTGQPVLDEDTILKFKTSYLMYKEGKKKYDRLLAGSHSGRLTSGLDYFIKNVMEDFSFNGEIVNNQRNRLINQILSSDGHIEFNWLGDDLESGAYSFLVGHKKEYGLAFLKLKFREKGLDIDDINISIDSSRYIEKGYSIISVDYKVKKYEKKQKQDTSKQQISNGGKKYFHPRAKELNELERLRQTAKRDNDQVGYNYAIANMERIVREYPATVTPEEWDKMDVEERISFINVKINEAKVLKDQDMFKFWNANLINLQNNRTQVYEYHAPLYNGGLGKRNSTVDDTFATKDYKYYYQEIMKILKKRREEKNFNDEEKKQMVGEIYYNIGYLANDLKNDQDYLWILSRLLEDIEEDDFEKNISKAITAEMQEKLQSESKKTKEPDTIEPKEKNKKEKLKNEDSMHLIDELKKKLSKIQLEHSEMKKTDGYIDLDELTILINRLKSLEKDAFQIMKKVNSYNSKYIIKYTIALIDEEIRKMTKERNLTIDSTNYRQR